MYCIVHRYTVRLDQWLWCSHYYANICRY